MSTTETSSFTSPKKTVLDHEPLAEVFYDELFYDAEVCSHCFTQIRDIEAIERDTWGSRLATHPTEHRTLTDNAVMGHDSIGPGSGKTMTEPTRPKAYCGECGRTSAPKRDRYSLSGMMEAADQIHTILTERGHDLDIDVLRDGIRALKTNPRAQGLDTEILAWSVGRALRVRPAVVSDEARRDRQRAEDYAPDREAEARASSAVDD